MMRIFFCCVCFLFAGILTLAAQLDSGGNQPQKPGRSAWFACTSIPDGLENPVKVLSDGKLTELKLPRYMTSDPVKIPEDGIIRIVREVTDPEDPAKIKYLVLAEAKIPETVREALIILLPLPKHIRVKLGDTKVSVAPKQANIYKAPNLAKPTNISIMYQFYHPVQKKWKILSASTVVLRPTRREINIFNDGTRIGNIKKHKILFPVQRKKP